MDNYAYDWMDRVLKKMIQRNNINQLQCRKCNMRVKWDTTFTQKKFLVSYTDKFWLANMLLNGEWLTDLNGVNSCIYHSGKDFCIWKVQNHKNCALLSIEGLDEKAVARFGDLL